MSQASSSLRAEDRDEALGLLRGLIERVVVHPADDGPQIELGGQDFEDGGPGPERKTGRTARRGGLFGQGRYEPERPDLAN
jgi:hypothetical protein